MSEFVTKDSGERAVFSTGMHRDTNTGKALFHLMFPKGVPYAEQMMTRVAELYGRGAIKYTARNWEKARTEAEQERFEESAFRHFVQWLAGETDEDHAAAVIFNLIGAEFVKYHRRQAEAAPSAPVVHDDDDFERLLDQAGAAQEEWAGEEFVRVPAHELEVDRATGRVHWRPAGHQAPPTIPLAAPEPPQTSFPVTLRVLNLDAEEGEG